VRSSGSCCSETKERRARARGGGRRSLASFRTARGRRSRRDGPLVPNASGRTILSDLFFTSGTNGAPQRCGVHARPIVAHVARGRPSPGLVPTDRYLVVQSVLSHLWLQGGDPGLPHGRRHCGTRSGLLRRSGHGAHCGGTHHRAAGAPDAVPDALDRAGSDEHDLSSLRLGVTGAAVVPVELVHAMEPRARLLHRAHRLRTDRIVRARSRCAGENDPPEDHRWHVGEALPGLEVGAVVDGRAVPAGEPGEDRGAGVHGHGGLLER